MNTKIFEIYGASESADTNPKRTWKWLGEVKTLTNAKKTAKRVSKMKMWYEVEIRGEEDNELIHHSYWQNGKLEINMSI